MDKGGAKVNIIANVLSEAPPASAGGEAPPSPEVLLGGVLPIIAIMLKAGRWKNRPAYDSLIDKKIPPSAPQGTAVREDGYKHATISRQAHASFIPLITATRQRHPRHQKHSPPKKYPLTPKNKPHSFIHTFDFNDQTTTPSTPKNLRPPNPNLSGS